MTTSVTIKNEEEVVKRLEEIIKSSMGNYSIRIDSPYAEYVEYGTHPTTVHTASGTIRDPETGEMITLTRKRFRDWAAEKYKVSGKERVKIGDRVYRQVMEHGMNPHPFIRPAIRDAEHMPMEDILKMVEAEDPAQAYMKFIADRMKEHLDKNNSIASGELKKSIHVVKAEEAPSYADRFDPEKRDKFGRNRL